MSKLSCIWTWVFWHQDTLSRRSAYVIASLWIWKKQSLCRLVMTCPPQEPGTCTVMGYRALMPRTQVLSLLLFSVQCSRNCSGGFKIREIQCMDSLDHHRSLRPFHCQFLAGLPPPLSMSCNLKPCEDWHVEPWSQVMQKVPYTAYYTASTASQSLSPIGHELLY